MEVPDDSPLRNPEKIPFPEPPPLVQNPIGVDNEEDTPNMRELVQEIESHVELVDLEITSNLDTSLPPLNSAVQPAGDVSTQSTMDTAHLSLRAPLLKEEETILLYLFLLLFFISLVLLGLPMVKGMW